MENSQEKCSNGLVKVTDRKSKKKRLTYSKENVYLALEAVRKGDSKAKASRDYNVPESTIRAKIKGLYADKKPGPCRVLSDSEEAEIVQWIITRNEKGYPVTKSQLIYSVKQICVNMKRKNTFVDNTPGRSWYDNFMKRHPEIAQRISENVYLNRARVTENNIREWFQEVYDILVEQNVLTIEPNRIFNSDESPFNLNPKPPKELERKGEKHFQRIVSNSENENISVLVTANAAGDLAPIFVLFAGQSLPDHAADFASDDFFLGFSPKGYIQSNNFYEYMANSFNPWLKEKNIKKPVIFYIDSHSSHLTLPLSKFCMEEGIILMTLYPNTTYVMQPLDVALFHSMKSNYQKISELMCRESSLIGLNMYQFAPVLKKTIESMKMEKTLQNGFRKCGLYPFNADGVDYKKVLNKMNKVSTTKSLDESETSERCSSPGMSAADNLKVIEKLLSKEKLEEFKANTDSVWRGVTKDESLFKLWYNLSHAQEARISNPFNSDTIYMQVFAENDECPALQSTEVFTDSQASKTISDPLADPVILSNSVSSVPIITDYSYIHINDSSISGFINMQGSDPENDLHSTKESSQEEKQYFDSSDDDVKVEPDEESLSAAIKTEQEKHELEEYRYKVATGSYADNTEEDLPKKKIKKSTYFSDEEESD